MNGAALPTTVGSSKLIIGSGERKRGKRQGGV
jgi:hypothetical protein